MTARRFRFPIFRVAFAVALLTAVGAARLDGQSTALPPTQKIDEEYTAKIREYTQDPRMITELVDHLPASDTVPTPLKVLGRIPGTPDEVTYYRDIVRYLRAVADASPRVAMFNIGKSDEGRDMVAVVIADEATIRSLDKYKTITRRLADPRQLGESEARQLIATGKPIYYATGAIHSPELGSPEMLMELAYRMAVSESPFIEHIRNNVIFMFTPVVETDGRDKMVDTFYYRKKHGTAPPLVYWGKYVAHDNNRDGMVLALNLTRNILDTFLDWNPTVLHDLHESVPYLYASTGTGPYNTALDPIVVDEWWMIAKHEVNELTKRGVPGVWTYGFYDGWTPNYMFWIANLRNSIGRFYETQSYGPGNTELTLPATSTSREWFRPNPPLAKIQWGPRNNVNLQQSGVLLALNYAARNRDTLLENFYLKNQRAIERGRAEAPHAWVIPAAQRRKVEAAELVNLMRRHGVEVHRAEAAFTAGTLQVAAGDYVIRMDQPYSTLVRMLFEVQYFPPANPRPYDDTGWTMPLLRNVQAHQAADVSVLEKTMTLLTADARVAGGITGTGSTVIVEHNTDNTLVTFRFAHPEVRMLAAQAEFEGAGRTFPAGSIIVHDADRAVLEPSLRELGLSAWAVASPPAVATHEMSVPRIGYVHSWTRTQDEGWVRLAFDHFKVPYTYFADQRLREGNLRANYDVIVFPHIGGSAQAQVNGLPMTGDPVPYRKSEETPHLGIYSESDDIRGGMGLEGLASLAKFVEEGGTLIVEGSTATIFPEYAITPGVSIEQPSSLFVRGSVMKGVFADRTSPIAYGYDGPALPIYFNQGPVFRAGGIPAQFRGFMRGGPDIPGVGQNITPNAVPPPQLATMEPREERPARPDRPQEDEVAAFRQMARQFGVSLDEAQPRVVLRFPSNPNDMLLSGSLAGGEALAGRALVLDVPLGQGHVVLFANRPFWRWSTQGSFSLAFNAIMHWDNLDAGRVPTRPETTAEAAVR
jgi:hypothetical protein